MTRETVAAVQDLMENGPGKSSLQDFFDAFSNNLIKKTENKNYYHIFQSIEKLLVKDSTAPETAAAKFGALAERLGLNYERVLLQLAEAEENDDYKITGNFIGEQNIETSLKYALLKLSQSLAVKQANTQEKPILKMLGEILALQLLNIFGQQETAENSSVFLINWLIPPGEKLLPLFLKIKKNNLHQNNAENPLYQIFLLFNTQHLGQVICRLALEEKYLSCGFTVKSRAGKRFMDNYLGDLRQKLVLLPWKIMIYPTRVSSAENIEDAWRKEFFEEGPGRVNILDARA